MRPDDPERWIEADLQCDDAGVELVEWFVIGRHIVCPTREPAPVQTATVGLISR